jgi:hypothetical protein
MNNQDNAKLNVQIDEIVRRPARRFERPRKRWDRGSENLYRFGAKEIFDAHKVEEWKEDDGTLVKSFHKEFINWGRTAQFKPFAILQPSSTGGLKNIVKWAKAHQKRVRVVGYPHSWSNLFREDGDILVSLCSLPVLVLSPTAKHPAYNAVSNEFERIELIQEEQMNGKGYGTLRIGAGVTMYQLQDWTRDNGYKYYFPFNIVMTEITVGGAIGPMCHGSGILNPTLSDLVVGLRFVNVHGDIQEVTDIHQLRTAAGAFGLMGVIISLNFRFEKMKWALMAPEKHLIEQAIPPPINFEIPQHMTTPSKTLNNLLWDRFIELAERSHYCEWVWFARHRECWVNCWEAQDETPALWEEYPTALDSWLQDKEIVLGNEVFNGHKIANLPYKVVGEIFSTATMAVLPPNLVQTGKITAPVCDALHFRHGIQNIPCIDFEVEIPIPTVDGHPQWEIVREAWWVVIKDCYDHHDTPLTVGLTMRLNGGSEMTLSPQHGNARTCSIEVSSHTIVTTEDWNAYIQRVFDLLCDVAEKYGLRDKVRPNWAKPWQGLTWTSSYNDAKSSMDIADYFRNVTYHDAIIDFRNGLNGLGQSAQTRYSAEDCRLVFSNPLLDYVIYGVGTPPPKQQISPPHGTGKYYKVDCCAMN